MRFPALIGLLLTLTAADAPATAPVVAVQVIARLPHDPAAFTEGFFVKDGLFWESTGEVGTSSIRVVDPASGKVKRRVTIAPPYFGEGIAPVGNEIVSLTWQHHLGFRWRASDFRKLGTFRYAGEGWSLASDGAGLLVMSDGTPTLRVLDPRTLAVKRTIAVTYNGDPLGNVNELELVHGAILANVWKTNAIVRVDPADGHVTGVLDGGALTREVAPSDEEAVPNGIAWDPAARKLYVTGKLWPTVFQVSLPDGW